MHRVAVFVHGCFWHRHKCHLFKWPKTRSEFWRAKIASNVARDMTALAQLREAGWRTLIIWECALKGRTRLGDKVLLDATAGWIGGRRKQGAIAGKRVRERHAG
jgi:DNA mismatch endonuclease (patch repair protein)